MGQTVPVAADEAAARRLLDRRPAVVMRTLDLERDASAARRARLLVAAACSEWDLDAIRGDAVLVVWPTRCCTRAPTLGWRCGTGRTG
jgi:hypothetical protein